LVSEFNILKESADTKKIVETLLRGVQQTINSQIMTPISTSISGLNALMSTLEKNPQLIQKCSEETIRNLNAHLNQIASMINGPTTQIQQIYQMTVADMWPQYFLDLQQLVLIDQIQCRSFCIPLLCCLQCQYQSLLPLLFVFYLGHAAIF
jgi:uncharacterized phage infection (PIP) family protein YhgE